MTLIDAAESGDVVELARQLDNGTAVNTRAPDGRTALHVALGEGHEDAANMLLARGADPSLVDHTGFTALHWAVYSNRAALLELASRGGTGTVDRPDVKGRTPFSLSARENAIVAMRWLLDHGADPNRTDADGWAPLHFAAADGQLEAVVFLLAAGADPMRRLPPPPGDSFGHIASDLARHYAPDRADVHAVLAAAESGRTVEA